jgi:hypothetical protein
MLRMKSAEKTTLIAIATRNRSQPRSRSDLSIAPILTPDLFAARSPLPAQVSLGPVAKEL